MNQYADQGFLNSIYMVRQEGHFSIPFEDNFNLGAIKRNRGNWLKYKDSIINFHFTTPGRKPWQERCGEHPDLEVVCQRWREVEKEVNQTLGIE